MLLMLPSGRYRQCQYTHTQSTNVLSVFRSGAKWFYLRKKFSTLLLSFFSNCFFFLKIKTFFFEGGGIVVAVGPAPIRKSSHTH